MGETGGGAANPSARTMTHRTIRTGCTRCGPAWVAAETAPMCGADSRGPGRFLFGAASGAGGGDYVGGDGGVAGLAGVGALARASPGLGPGDFTSERLLGYLAQRKASGVGESALRRAVAAFRSFFRHALGQKVTPGHALPWPKVHKRRQRVLDWETALAVGSACDTATHRGTRDLAILLLILDSSIRASAP